MKGNGKDGVGGLSENWNGRAGQKKRVQGRGQTTNSALRFQAVNCTRGLM